MCPEPRAPRASVLLLCALLLAAQTGCALPPPAAPPSSAPAAAPAAAPTPAAAAPASGPAQATAPAPVSVHAVAAPEPAVALPVQGAQPGAIHTDHGDATTRLLVYAERLRRMPPAELAQEVAQLGAIAEAQRQPSDDLRAAMALAQTRAPADLARAQTLLARVLASPREDARGLYPLAGLLAARIAEQRRVEEALERQAQQLREQQRRIEQLNERLEAVRAIERSLTARPPANGSPPRAPLAAPAAPQP